MGLHYDSHCGLGVKVKTIQGLNPQQINEDYGFIDKVLDGSKYEYFFTGWLDDKEQDLFLTIREPFSDGNYNLKSKVKEFKKFLKANKIKYEGDVDIVGGLSVS